MLGKPGTWRLFLLPAMLALAACARPTATPGSRSGYRDCVGPSRGLRAATKVPRPTVASSSPSCIAS